MPKFSPIRSHRNGFTLIELLVAVMIIIVLTTAGVSSFTIANRNSRNAKRQADAAQVRSALEIYRSTTGTYPPLSTGNTGSNFITLMGSAYLGPYMASGAVQDPRNTGAYRYEYTSPRPGGSVNTYQICYYLEPSATQTCVYSP